MPNAGIPRFLPGPVLGAALVAALACGCSSEPEKPRPVVVVGVDGADWRVIDPMWKQGMLPNLRALSESGVRATLRTDYGSKSAVVWTTVATGVTPEKHGIRDFVVRTPRGDVPVSSTVRKVPAIWNMASLAGRRVAVLGWWASWPAETVNGVVVSDRAHHGVEQGVFPADWLSEFDRLFEEARTSSVVFPSDSVRQIDELVAYVAWKLATGDFDLLMVYFRSVDEVSHRYWKFFHPQAYANVDAEELIANRDRIPGTYRAVDEAIGRIVSEAADANVVVVSDHGFYGLKHERLRVSLDLDKVLAHLGFLSFNKEGGVDLERTTVYTHVTPLGRSRKKVRFSSAVREAGGTMSSESRDEIRRGLETELAKVRYSTGSPVFQVLEPNAQEEEEGADLLVKTLSDGATPTITIEGKVIEGAIGDLHSISGSHGEGTHGILLASGPDIDPRADLAQISIHDVTPTLLFGMGLPVAEDFDGRPYTGLFREEFRQRFPLRTIKSWGSKGDSEAATSKVDEELIEQLRALGYLD